MVDRTLSQKEVTLGGERFASNVLVSERPPLFCMVAK